ncbi:hypothetical protein H0H87_003694 [Tephrocybe sp. NHM501043]|nr:hypothetical protein H0H87_003694 [Tephrocybe sp. NHM501043]
MRLFSTKFRARPPPPMPRPSTQLNSAFGSKETREAALRERGLLPPLKPNADLSTAEFERDRLLPVLMPPSHEEVLMIDGEETNVSAALRVKQEWEAKHNDEKRELERMRSFTFGGPPCRAVKGSSSSTSLLASATVEPVDGLSSVLHDGPTLTSGTTTPALSIRSKRSLPALVLQLDDHKHPKHPTLPPRASSSVDPPLIPLPPSPSPSLRSPRSREELAAISLAASFPLPPSPRLNVPQRSPTISLTPPPVPPSMPIQHGRTESASSRLTAISGTVSYMKATSSFEHSLNPAPAIVESPIEESILNGSFTGRDCEPAVVTTTETKDVTHSVARSRNPTDPIEAKEQTPERRKSFNPFKRNQISSPEAPDKVSPPTTSPSRRLSMSASLSNMRRSVIGTISRPKATGLVKMEKGFDASHLPPSPTIPAVFAQDAGGSSTITPKWPSPFQHQQHSVQLEVKTRIPVSPTLYSRGTIVAETSNIEDDESRRMTELAFLG